MSSIPLQTTFDKIINCSDATNEYCTNTDRLGGLSDFICDIFFCHEHVCGRYDFSCGDGTCTYTLYGINLSECVREVFAGVKHLSSLPIFLSSIKK